MSGFAGRELGIEAIELGDQKVDALHGVLPALAKLANLVLLTADAPIALRQLASQRRDLGLRAPVLVYQRSDRFFESLEVVAVEGLGNRLTPAQARRGYPSPTSGVNGNRD
jgi:hypothetical protein